jgi:electron transport complex protein RnfC
MLKKAFFGLGTPQIEYQRLNPAVREPRQVPLPGRATLLLEGSPNGTAAGVKVGDRIKTGQPFAPQGAPTPRGVSTVTGTVAAVEPFAGDFGRAFTAVTIDVDSKEEIDEAFAAVSATPTLESAAGYLDMAPGDPPMHLFGDPDNPIRTIVVYGGNTDLLVTTNQFVIETEIEAITKGIAALKAIAGVEDVIIAVPRDLVPGFGHVGATFKAVDTVYPAGLPRMIMADVLARPVPAGKSPADLGVAFFSAEAAAAIGKAYATGRVPVDKILTFVDKDGNAHLVRTRIGTPVGDIFKLFGVEAGELDRIILGGPMTGSAIYSESHPVQPGTDCLMIQAREDVPHVSDYPCVNCGECNRVCPARIAVNMLVRFLEAGQYEAAADEYDLHSCVECGLCSFVCVARIPIFQLIRLAKHELARLAAAEETNA